MEMYVVYDFIRDSFIEAKSGWAAVVIYQPQGSSVRPRLAEEPNILERVGRVREVPTAEWSGDVPSLYEVCQSLKRL